MAQSLEARLVALGSVPIVRVGDDLAAIVLAALDASGERLRPGDAVVVAQKVFSKAEGQAVRLDTVVASERARQIAQEVGKDPRLVELILSESNEVLRKRRDLLVVEHRLGFVTANAGIDVSNVAQAGEDDTVLLLPAAPDESCALLRTRLREGTGVDVPVIMNDSHGRAFRNGVVGVAIGVSGMGVLADLRGTADLFGRALRATEVAVADELAAAASALMGQAGEGRPIVLARGFAFTAREGRAAELVRPPHLDVFR